MRSLRLPILLGFVAASLLIAPAAADDCRFVLGFKAIHDQIPDLVGNCLDNEGYNPDNGDALQHTTAWHGKGGLMAWRKSDNWTAFTDGANTWLNGPYGIQKRLNSDRFAWERDPIAQVPTTKASIMTGSGQQVTQKMHLDAGLAIFRTTHSGRSNFIVWLLDSHGNEVGLVANDIGSFTGAKAMAIERAGDFVANVSADGAWTLSVEQPKPTSGTALPQTFNGHGSSVSPFFQASGLHTFRLTHSGRSNFVVWLLNAQGGSVSLVANGIGRFDGSKAVGLDGGIYLLNIAADGDWAISVD